MGDSNPPSAELLKFLLEPLLDDFEHWFDRYRRILENEKIKFMSEQEQLDLLKRVRDAAGELKTAKMLFMATNREVGIDMATLKPWHQLVAECWGVGMRLGLAKE